MRKIFDVFVTLHGDKALKEEVIVDFTVQEKNIAFPIDTKLLTNIEARCRLMAKLEGVKLRCSYQGEIKKLLRIIRFKGNPFDGHTLSAVLTQVESVVGQRPTKAICDRGYRGKRQIRATRIKMQESGKLPKTYHGMRKARERFRLRGVIEPVIGHLKNDHGVLRNYHKGRIGDSVNLFMVCAAFNFRKFIRILYFVCIKLFGTYTDQVFSRCRHVSDVPFLEFSAQTILILIE